jgi:hypothetical protein
MMWLRGRRRREGGRSALATARGRRRAGTPAALGRRRRSALAAATAARGRSRWPRTSMTVRMLSWGTLPAAGAVALAPLLLMLLVGGGPRVLLLVVRPRGVLFICGAPRFLLDSLLLLFSSRVAFLLLSSIVYPAVLLVVVLAGCWFRRPMVVLVLTFLARVTAVASLAARHVIVPGLLRLRARNFLTGALLGIVSNSLGESNLSFLGNRRAIA